jgi:hypothetical protein
MKYNLTKTEKYILVLKNEPLEIGDWCYGLDINSGDYITTIHPAGSHDLYNKHPKVIAHLPINNTEYLEGVDVLPELSESPSLEDDVEKLAIKEVGVDGEVYNEFDHLNYIKGYNKAKETYKYTEDDLKKAFKDGGDVISWSDFGVKVKYNNFEHWFDYNIKSKIPIDFECEMEEEEVSYKIGGIKHRTFIKQQKKITNSKGITEWVGKYIY